MLSIREELAPGCVGIGVGRGELQALGVRVALQETLDLKAVFLVKNRAGRVQQFTISAQQLPQRIEDAPLRARELLDVAGAPQPFDIGMAPRDARSRARYVGEDTVVRFSVPPRRRLARV